MTSPHALAQGAKSKGGKSGTAAKAKPKSPATPSKLDQHLAANMKMFQVLRRYAETLNTATDAATAHQAVTKLEEVTKEAILAGEELVKLGKPTPDIGARLTTDADLIMTSRTVAEQTRNAVKTLAENAEAKVILAPAVENFQAALNRVQQAAEEPAGIAAQPGGNPAPPPTPPPAPAESPATQPAAETTQVPPPPPPSE